LAVGFVSMPFSHFTASVRTESFANAVCRPAIAVSSGVMTCSTTDAVVSATDATASFALPTMLAHCASKLDFRMPSAVALSATLSRACL
jgi:tRNA U38,U39,U40 pseudouridine synthase TruA